MARNLGTLIYSSLQSPFYSYHQIINLYNIKTKMQEADQYLC